MSGVRPQSLQGRGESLVESGELPYGPGDKARPDVFSIRCALPLRGCLIWRNKWFLL